MLNLIATTTKGYLNNYEGLPGACWLGISLIFIDAVAGGICFFLSIYFVNNLKLSIASAGLLISAYGLGTVLGGILGGKLSDTLNPRLTSQMSLLLQSLSFLLLTQLRSVETLLINLFFMGIAAYIFKTSINCWILNQCGTHSELKLKTLNIVRVASNLGLAISGTIIGLVTTKSFSILFLISSITFLISSFIFVLKEDKKKIISANATSETHVDHPLNNQRSILTALLIFVFLIGLMIGQLGTTYPIFIQDNLGIKAVSILFILDTLLIVMFQAPLVNFLKKSNKIFFTGFGGLLMGAGMLILNIAPIFPLAVISCIIWTTGEMLFIPLAQLLCYEKGLRKKQGARIGTYQAVYALGTISGPTLGTVIYYHFGGEMVWYICGIIGLSCFLVCNRIKRYN